MLLANMIVGKVMITVDRPNAVLRRHEPPTDRKIDFMNNLTKFFIKNLLYIFFYKNK